MNILEAEDVVKGLPDQVLFQYAQNPPPNIPQYLAVSEVQRRQDMRQRFQAQQQGMEPTVKDQVLQGGIASAGGPPMPPEGMPMEAPMEPPMAPPQGPPQGMPQGMPMSRGGMTRMAEGGLTGGARELGEAFVSRLRERASSPAGIVSLLPGMGSLEALASLGPRLRQFLPPPAPSPTGFDEYFPSSNQAGLSLGNVVQMPVDPNMRDPESDELDRQYQALISSQQNAMYAPFHSTMAGFDPTAGGTYDPGSQVMSSISGPGNPNIPGGMSRGGMTRMAGGGLTPGGIVYMQEGRQAPNLFAELRAAQAAGDVQRVNQIQALIDAQRAQDPIYRLMGRFGRGPEPSAASAVTQAAAPLAAPVAAPAAAPDVVAPLPQPPYTTGGPSARRGQGSIQLSGIVAADQAMREETGEPPVVPPAAMDTAAAPAATPAAPLSERQTRLNEMMAGLPGVMQQMQGLTPQVPSFTMQDLQRFAPRPFDDSAIMARREALIEQLQGAGRTRREEDIAAAERYRTEAEAPIQAAQDEARRAAIASTLMRLGSGLAAGDPAQGLASASQAVENIMTRAREQAASERRAVRQEFRQAEREATRGERDVANTVFQMQAQQITSDENRQRDLARDQMQFSQWAFGQLRDQGKDQRQAYTESIRLGASLLQAVDTAVRDEIKNKRISQDQYTSTVGALLRTVNETLKENLPDDMDLSTPEGLEAFNKMAINAAKSQLEGLGIRSPSSDGVVTVTTPQELELLESGDRYRGPDGIVRIKP